MTFAPVERADWLWAPPGLDRVPHGSVTTPAGYEAAGVACGLKPSGALDVGVLVSRRRAVSALVDTRNALPSAPVLRNRDCDPAGFQAVVVNAGTANAATGSPGKDDAAWMAQRTAAHLGLAAHEVAVCSTGTIGDRLDRDRVGGGIDTAAGTVTGDGGEAFSQAIMTTDAFPKAGAFRLPLGGRDVHIGIAAKGAGMIAPNMGTMLAFVTTDAAVDAAGLAGITSAAAHAAFNRVTVDGQTSPSDTLLVLANGDGTPLAGPDLATLSRAITAVCRWAGLQMVRDGEGATHAVRLLVMGARDPDEAAAVARHIGNSPLVKSAVFGRDPNWGRVSQAVGQALAGRPGDACDPVLHFDGLPLGDPGVPAVMERAEYELEVALGRGDATAELFFSDLTHAYVTLNADYHT
ncbi:MAG: bifunctional glutamate N-acetyltransferase/amino-acid acetyltransferase ArgJ [Actinomycetota bacterium]